MASIIFDLDGTLIDSAPDIRATVNALLEQEGVAPLSLAETRSFIGGGVPLFISRMRAARELPDTAQARLVAAFTDRYEAAVDLTVPYPGVPEALAALQADGHALAICTNKPQAPARAVLRHLALERFFPVLIGGDSLAVRKPDPAPLHAAIEALPEGPALYVGDSEVDAATAQAADIPFLLFTEGYRKSPLGEIPHAHAFSAFGTLPEAINALL